LSASPIVNTAISLLFAFIGGSLVSLLKGKNENIKLTGMGMSFFSLAMIIGISTGIFFRVVREEQKIVEEPLFRIKEPLSVEDIIELKGLDPYLLRAILGQANKNETKKNLPIDALKKLGEENIHPSVILGMINIQEEPIEGLPIPLSINDILALQHGNHIPKDSVIHRMLVNRIEKKERKIDLLEGK